MLEGKFKLSTHLPTDAEKRLFGIFISHSNKDNELLKQLTDMMEGCGLNPIYDRDILLGGDKFQDRIQECINCYAGVVIITENSLNSDWVNYELGYFAGLSMPVVLWDPHELLSLDTMDKNLLNSHYSKYFPAHKDLDTLIDALEEMSIYSDIFKDECIELTKTSFKDIMSKRVQTVMVKLESDIFDTERLSFKDCKIGTLIVNFGMFHPNNGDGKHCYAERNMPELTNGICANSGMECALYDLKSLDGHNIECVVLNYCTYNGRFYKKGEKDAEGNIIEHSYIMFYVPIHTLFGTEFKFIVDAPNNAQHYKLMTVFESVGMNPTVSDSLNGRRIYLSLSERPRQGFFRLNHEFNNNFLCPYAVKH